MFVSASTLSTLDKVLDWLSEQRKKHLDKNQKEIQRLNKGLMLDILEMEQSVGRVLSEISSSQKRQYFDLSGALDIIEEFRCVCNCPERIPMDTNSAKFRDNLESLILLLDQCNEGYGETLVNNLITKMTIYNNLRFPPKFKTVREP